MPHWWWTGQDGCWFCKDRNACHNCSVIKKARKQFFAKKEKGRIQRIENKKTQWDVGLETAII